MKRVRAILSAFVVVAVFAACGGGGGGDEDAQGGDGVAFDGVTGDVQVPPGDADGGGGGFETFVCTKNEDCVGRVAELTACQVEGCSNGACVAVAGNDGATCDDANACTENDVCAAGSCAGTATCPACGSTPDCAQFEDETVCNGTLACVEGYCVLDPATVVECPAADDCAEYVCNADTGECDAVAMNVGEACEGTGACDTQVFECNDLGACACVPCEPNCELRECGDDGCGGTCEPGCGAGDTCTEQGECVPADPCLGLVEEGCCEDGLVVYCNAGVLDSLDCGAQGAACGWNAEFSYYDCVAEPTTDPAGTPRECALECPTDCAAEGVECGLLPGCPFIDCGGCGEGEVCGADGQCEVFVDPCQGVSEAGCCDDGLLLWCEGGALQFIQCADPATCGWNADAGFYDCGTAGEPAPGNDPAIECPAIECGTCADQGVACGLNPTCPWLECESGCTGSDVCVEGECVPDRCLGVADVGCCDGDVIYGCSQNMLFSSDCTETEGNICGWYVGDDQFLPGYYCGPADLLVDEDPSGENPAACSFDACDNATFCAEAGYECGMGCPGESCGDCGADGFCRLDRTCFTPSATTISCESTVTGNNADGQSDLAAYGCSSWDESGPELFYAFTATASETVTIYFNEDEAAGGVVLTGDLDLFVLIPPFGAESCVAGNSSVELAVEAGQTYYIVVDGFGGATSEFALVVDCLSQCADPQCDGRECGPAPGPLCAGVVCGADCPGGELCVDGQCQTDPCLGVSGAGCCMDGVNYFCGETGLASEDCGDAGCGWLDFGFFAFYGCGGVGEDPLGEFPLACDFGACDDATFCDEMGYECGLGCPGGTSCGTCAEGEYCTVDRQCEVCSCEALGLECGTHPVPECALECGACEDGFFCTAEQLCEAVPFCGENTNVGAIECGAGPVTVSGDTTDSVNVLDSYPGCFTYLYTGPEEYWTFTPECSGPVTVTLAGPAEGVDMDLLVLRAECRGDGEFCIGGSDSVTANEQVTFDAEAGVTYYLVIDALGVDAVGAYDLSVDCACTCTPECGDRECGPDPVCHQECGPCREGQICDAGTCSTPAGLTCATPGTLACGGSVLGDTTTSPNVMETYDCSFFTEAGGEDVYLLTLTPDTLPTLTLSGMTTDLDLLLFEVPDGGACGAAACIATSSTAGTETLEFEPVAGATYYAVVETYLAAEPSTYTLALGCAAACVPDCTGLECGPDPVCGEECGPCIGDAVCDAGTCVAACAPECTGLECGPDPVCGEECGPCTGGAVCDAGTCVAACVPDCTGLECGPDPVCGEECGPCTGGAVCDAGACVSACDAPTGVLSCADNTVMADTTGGPTLVPDYLGCTAWPEPGPEHLYTFTAPEAGDYTFTLFYAAGMDLDLFVLDASCDLTTCVDFADSELTITAAAGETYHVFVDGYATEADPTVGYAGAYHLMVTCPNVEVVTILPDGETWVFDPQDLTVPVGTSVMWINLATMIHNSTSTADPPVWASPNLAEGESFQWTFDTVGTYPYECTLHPTMTGAITVE